MTLVAYSFDAKSGSNRGLRALFVKLLAVLPLLLLAIATPGRGQAISVNGGSIQGTITDPSGAAVAKATIVVTYPLPVRAVR